MRYQGGKEKLSPHIVRILETLRPECSTFVDVFCGGLSITSRMGGNRIANDACKPLIILFEEWMKGWRPPGEISEEQYRKVQDKMDLEDPLTAFVGIGLSFGGSWFNGYARSWKKGCDFVSKNTPGAVLVNMTEITSSTLDKKLSRCRGVQFHSVDYKDLNIPERSLVYLDPPYKGTKQYSGVSRPFNHEEFFEWALYLSSKNVVVLSEYEAPDPWEEIWRKLSLNNIKQSKVEKLFMVKQ